MNKIVFYILSFLIVWILLFFLRIIYPIQGGYIPNIVVEFHGLLFDVILFGIILTLFESRTQKKIDIKRWREEIDDYRYWKEIEAGYRIKGLLKRLNANHIYNINLSNIFIRDNSIDNLYIKYEPYRSKKLLRKLVPSLMILKEHVSYEINNFELDKVIVTDSKIINASLRASFFRISPNNVYFENCVFINPGGFLFETSTIKLEFRDCIFDGIQFKLDKEKIVDYFKSKYQKEPLSLEMLYGRIKINVLFTNCTFINPFELHFPTFPNHEEEFFRFEGCKSKRVAAEFLDEDGNYIGKEVQKIWLD